MEKLIISSYDEFANYVGKEIGVSEYLQITQDQINLFADATMDHQWIHTDPERAKTESPFGSTIAHGYLSLSLLPYLWTQIIEVKNIKLLVNYGIEKLKFNQEFQPDDYHYGLTSLKSLINLRGISKAKVNVRLEIKGNPKPAFNATLIFLYHFIEE